jgi:glycerophosphoryl diester phosphodiesterase
MSASFDLQGHRGARGLKPENTLPSFEIAFDLGVTSVETDVHLTFDGVPVIIHDPVVSGRLCRRLAQNGTAEPADRPLVSTLTLAQLRGYAADRNPDPGRFPRQDARTTPLAELFGRRHGLHPYTPPTLADLFAFAEAYSGEPGCEAGKTQAQQVCARRVRFDLELKRVPFHPEHIGDAFDGSAPAALERRLVETVVAAGMVARTTVRSFDHRAVLALRRLEPRLTAAVLAAGMAPVSIASLVRHADAHVYCPDYRFLDEPQVRQAKAEGIRVIPWTVNQPDHWQRLLDWGVDGITTDFPDRLAKLLTARGVAF